MGNYQYDEKIKNIIYKKSKIWRSEMLDEILELFPEDSPEEELFDGDKVHYDDFVTNLVTDFVRNYCFEIEWEKKGLQIK